MQITRAIFAILILGFAEIVSFAQWQKQRSGSLAWLYAIQFVDVQTGFAAGSNGTLLATRDAGAQWEKMPLPVSDTIRDLHFADSRNGWLLCDRGKLPTGANTSYLLRTRDAGKTWSVVEFKNSPERFSRLFFSAGGAGFLIGEGGIMAGLPRGEDREARFGLPLRFLMVDGVMPDDSSIVLAGGGGSLIISQDGGLNWQEASFADTRPESKLNAVHFIDRRNGWVAGSAGLIFSTTDGGRSWRRQISGTETDLFDIAFYDRDHGFAVGDGGIIVRTINGGATWAPDKSGSKHRLERIAFAGKRAIAVGFGGTIISKDLPR